ncbi:hypothetical protein J7426_04825 [Tropicibacter sp. R16_0]|uniref:hypothetical protein n=1 Tax=Tropicibacter sp. R16_0 TaxID=2821102 RepID=UPI001ADA73AA|nr:hypothetical protein [Tropicibacter sp. R16_0]MBO9449568.1 hypothetical protein [Tropicibacter sp. R16_0]
MQVKQAILAVTLLAGGATAADAGPDQVSILLGSHHVGATRNFEEFNPGIILTWKEILWQNRLDVGFGVFRNSYGDASVVATTAFPLVRNQHWGLDLFAALATYPGEGDQFTYSIGDVVPIAGLQARYRNVFVQAIPSGGSSVDATLTYGLTFALD